MLLLSIVLLASAYTKFLWKSNMLLKSGFAGPTSSKSKGFCAPLVLWSKASFLALALVLVVSNPRFTAASNILPSAPGGSSWVLPLNFFFKSSRSTAWSSFKAPSKIISLSLATGSVSSSLTFSENICRVTFPPFPLFMPSIDLDCMLANVTLYFLSWALLRPDPSLNFPIWSKPVVLECESVSGPDKPSKPSVWEALKRLSSGLPAFALAAATSPAPAFRDLAIACSSSNLSAQPCLFCLLKVCIDCSIPLVWSLARLPLALLNVSKALAKLGTNPSAA